MKWEYTSAEVSITDVVFEMMDTYTQKRQNTAAQSIAMQSLLDLCEATERKQGEQMGMPWLEQAGIDLAGARETAVMAAEAEEDGLED